MKLNISLLLTVTYDSGCFTDLELKKNQLPLFKTMLPLWHAHVVRPTIGAYLSIVKLCKSVIDDIEHVFRPRMPSYSAYSTDCSSSRTWWSYVLNSEPSFAAGADQRAEKTTEPSRRSLSERLPGLSCSWSSTRRQTDRLTDWEPTSAQSHRLTTGWHSLAHGATCLQLLLRD